MESGCAHLGTLFAFVATCRGKLLNSGIGLFFLLWR